MMYMLTCWIMRESLQQVGEWRTAGLPVTAAVNLSMRDLREPDLPHYVAGLLADLQLHPEWLEVEITESTVMADPEATFATLEALRAIGVRSSIDDFGTGYSSLAYLKRLPVNEIKIDRAFVLNMTSDARDTAIVRATLDLAHNLGLKVVAEGVEDQRTHDFVANIGCDAVQGYFIGRPMGAGDLATWFEQQRATAS
jgi:EAL domain-containing protein (putative c-di-GMP-specific phosphodiesterase class I)